MAKGRLGRSRRLEPLQHVVVGFGVHQQSGGAHPRKITLEDIGLSEDDLAAMDERQNTADSFEFDNRTWLYVISREVQSQRSDRRQPEGFYYWEFRENAGPGILSVRKAENEPFAVTLFNAIPPGDVTVYRGRA